jgi:hypothetical protein
METGGEHRAALGFARTQLLAEQKEFDAFFECFGLHVKDVRAGAD